MLDIKRLGTVAAVIGLTAAGTIAATGTASAASYNGVCGSGYGVIDTMDVGAGTAYLTYSGSTGRNCVVTVSDTPGTATLLDARVRLHRTGYEWKDSEYDAAVYKYYAGPVYLSAAGRCIDWGGAAASADARVDYGVHCG